ncbi:hypothetical protein Naga_100119g6 [Nannochloropsis gaditana]|uniref:Uncharacterized protein n=1 Tax=Nannochloropsis gaditana TaxID=72520 RepID=W7U8V1_9STRA|nr:hypothetical protein Naga_100119g6 [Nannochloropsis gaditana]
MDKVEIPVKNDILWTLRSNKYLTDGEYTVNKGRGSRWFLTHNVVELCKMAAKLERAKKLRTLPSKCTTAPFMARPFPAPWSLGYHSRSLDLVHPIHRTTTISQSRYVTKEKKTCYPFGAFFRISNDT